MLAQSLPRRRKWSLRAHQPSRQSQSITKSKVRETRRRICYAAEALESRFLLAVATHYSVSLPANTTAGTAFNFTVVALDASNQVATGYSGTVHFGSTDSNGTVPANTTMASA